MLVLCRDITVVFILTYLHVRKTRRHGLRARASFVRRRHFFGHVCVSVKPLRRRLFQQDILSVAWRRMVANILQKVDIRASFRRGKKPRATIPCPTLTSPKVSSASAQLHLQHISLNHSITHKKTLPALVVVCAEALTYDFLGS